MKIKMVEELTCWLVPPPEPLAGSSAWGLPPSAAASEAAAAGARPPGGCGVVGCLLEPKLLLSAR